MSLRASARFGRATRLRELGDKEGALSLAREALALLAGKSVIRTNPPEASTLICATVLVEQLAQELARPGASEYDISDSLTYIRELGAGSDLAGWASYLEGCLRENRAAKTV